jgi:hypothetical protein
MISSRRVSRLSSRLVTEGLRAAACFLRGAAMAPLAEGFGLTDFVIDFSAI